MRFILWWVVFSPASEPGNTLSILFVGGSSEVPANGIM